ncbi:SDR family NAD(P)-dependent oxidoreductase [Streptomyces sp. NPDC050658]|uniref:SDR family NAD(P)-dependent oxidoreductase n=1 Tax=unclassified Streptomyces TaxID=2593676 RepID=UPI00341AAF89
MPEPTSSSASARGTTVVIGAGPGLGMSIAHRFGREGYSVALVSRSGARHSGYVAELSEAGIEAGAFVADVQNREQLLAALDAIAERYGTIDLVYYGPGADDPDARPKPITETDAESARAAMNLMYPALDVVNKVLPGMLERGDGGLLFAGGLSALTPMPPLGAFAISSAALRNYALTLNAALADKGIHAASLIIGGLIERGDIHRSITSRPETFGDVGKMSLNPDTIADEVWDLHARRERAEAVFSAFA